MITTFTIENRKTKGIGRVFLFFARDKIVEEYRDYKNLVIRNIHYINRKNNINWQAVYNRAGYDGKCLVCNSDIVFPEKSHLARFVTGDFQGLMAENFAINVLNEMKNSDKVKIAFFDYDGRNRHFVERLCKYSDNFIIVSAEKEKYFNLSEKMMREEGVSLIITNRIDRMNDADLVIAPGEIRKITNLKRKSVVLTGVKPCFDVSGVCYHSYKVDVPKEYIPLIPEDMDEEYFLSALYSKGRLYNLSKLQPKVAYNENSTCTVKSLGKYLDRITQ